MKAVGHLDEHNAYVLAHGEEELAEVLGLHRGLVAEDAARYLCEALHELRYLVAEVLADVVDGVVGVLHHVVEQGGAYRRGAKPYLAARYARHGYGVQYVGLARAAAHAAVGLFGKAVGTLDYLDFLAVVARQIACEQLVESRLYVAFFAVGEICSFVFHCVSVPIEAL